MPDSAAGDAGWSVRTGHRGSTSARPSASRLGRARRTCRDRPSPAQSQTIGRRGWLAGSCRSNGSGRTRSPCGRDSRHCDHPPGTRYSRAPRGASSPPAPRACASTSASSRCAATSAARTTASPHSEAATARLSRAAQQARASARVGGDTDPATSAAAAPPTRGPRDDTSTTARARGNPRGPH